MKSEKYADLLRDPRWQKKRLEILSRDDWTCQSCGDGNKTLAVHHRMYGSDRKPWEYPDEILVTLCEDCHKKEYDRKKLENRLIEATRLRLFAVDVDTLAEAFECSETTPDHREMRGVMACLWLILACKEYRKPVRNLLMDLP